MLAGDSRQRVVALPCFLASGNSLPHNCRTPYHHSPQSAKAERKAIALCRQLERLQQERSLAKSHWLLALPRTARMAVLAFALFASTTALVQPAYLPPRAAWPLSRWLSFTSGKRGRGQGGEGAGGSAALPAGGQP